jgi:hypothetical protein
MNWEAPMLNIMLNFLNTFIIKGIDIYFGYQNKVYVISKQLIMDVFGVCAKGYIEKLKGQVSKSLAYKFYNKSMNAKSLGLPYSIRYLAIISMIYQRDKVKYFSNKNAITLMRVEKWKKVDWAHIIYNSLCSELNWWYKYVKDNKGDKKDTY